jgi:hypothetical protein
MSAVQPLQVYNGQVLIGEIEDRGRGNVAAFKFDHDDRIKVGTYPTRIAAMRALAKPSPKPSGSAMSAP